MAGEKVVIVGAGLVGSLAAIYLAKRGFQVEVYEKRSDMRNEPFVRGRSINLALSARGIAALAKVGLSEQVLNDGIPMHSRMIHVGMNEPVPQPYGLYGEAINSIDRRKLNELLMTVAEGYKNVNFFFHHECLQMNLDEGETIFLNRQANFFDIVGKTVKAEFILGSDGVYSAVRKEIMKKTRMNYSQEYVSHGYKELTIYPKDNTFAMKPNYLHIWPKKEFMMIALPNQDCTFTCTLFFPFTLFDKLKTQEDVLQLFKKEFPDSLQIMEKEHLIQEYFQNPVGPLVTIKASPYNYKGKAIILGDAAHAMVPFYGQGMNAGFEDVLILDSIMDEESNIEAAFEKFSKVRHPQAVSICDLAADNYYEMSTSVISPLFHVQKKIYNVLHYLFPSSIMPLYSMVSFSTIPYDQVVKKRDWQARLVKKLGIALSCFGFTGIAAISILLSKRFAKA